jgi:putative spermidine/putrescine transport system substrate-binding protein
MNTIMRKATWGAAAIFASTVVVSPAMAAEDPITIVSWGGAWSAAVKGAWTDPYEKETGQKFNFIDYNGGIAEIRAQVEAGNVTWDIVDLIPGDGVLACDEGLLEEMDHSRIPASADGTPGDEDWVSDSLLECGIGATVWATVMAYKDDTYPGEKPTAIADFWDFEKFPGTRGMRKVAEVNLEWALIADGVARDQVYALLSTPAGVDRAFKKLDEIKEHTIWWEAGAQAPQLLVDGEVALGTAYNGRIYNAYKNENQPLSIMWDTQVWDIGHYGVVKGAPHKDAAMKYLMERYSTPEYQGRITYHIAYGPMRKSASAFIDPAIKGHLPTDHLDTALQFDFRFWADHKDELQERFSAWLAL